MERPDITTERLTLRVQKSDDAETITALLQDRRISQMTMRIPYPYKISDATQWIENAEKQAEEGTGLQYAITLTESGELVGAVGLEINQEHGRAELGYWLGVPYWSRGYVTEAAGALMRHGFDTVKLNKVTAHHFATNPASGRVMQKIGLLYEGYLPEHITKNGAYIDVVLYGLTQKQYREKQMLEQNRHHRFRDLLGNTAPLGLRPHF